jgi:4-hydroxybenzoyl-CoA reductase subunit beta
MRLPRFEYVRPKTIEEAVSAIAPSNRKATILAGGTDLLVNMKYRVVCPETVVSIKHIAELCAMSAANGHMAIGACATLTDLVHDSSTAQKFSAFNQAVRAIASQHLRNMATLGGNVCLDTRCWYYNQSKLWRDARELCHRTGGTLCHAIKGAKRCHAINNSDTAPVLIALDAQIAVAGKGQQRMIQAKDFYQDDGIKHTDLEPGEIVTSITLPQGNGDSHATFIKISMRKGIDFAMASIAAAVNANGKAVSSARLVMGSVASRPIMLEKASQVIMESGLTEKSIENAGEVARTELGILTNLFTSSGYKRQLTEVLVKRVLKEIKDKTGKAGRVKK